MIIQISGKLRQGKGILMTLLGLLVADSGGEILANYHLKTPNASLLDFYDFLYLLKKPRQKRQKTILIDELPTWIDSYCSTTSKSNRMASHFCNQSAKLGYNLIYTAQRTRRADINYREMVDLSCQAQKNEEAKMFEYTILDPEFVDEDVPTNRKIRIPYALASQFWNRYDTYESVVPLGLDEFFFELEKTDPARLNRAVDRQVHLLNASKYRGNCSVLSVKNALLQLGESVVFADLVSARLKEPYSITLQSPMQPTQ